MIRGEQYVRLHSDFDLLRDSSVWHEHLQHVLYGQLEPDLPENGHRVLRDLTAEV